MSNELRVTNEGLQKLQEETEMELLEVLDEWEKLSQDMALMN